jgi:hypothetical protein
VQRDDLPAAVRAQLFTAQTLLWSAINATHSMSNSELWSWSFAAGHYGVVPFGSSAADVDESDAAQLWSTTYLALKPVRADHQSSSAHWGGTFRWAATNWLAVAGLDLGH